jgi:hypothetical protein
MWFAKWFGAREAHDDDEPARHAPVQITVRPAEAPPVNARQAAKPRAGKGKGFDPYNSGAFERRNAWGRITRR